MSSEHHAFAIETDSAGDDRIAGEALLIGSQRDVNAALDAGFDLIAQHALASQGQVMVRLGVPESHSVESAVERLQQLAPSAEVAANHVYRSAEASVRPAAASARNEQHRFAGSIGVIDTGVDAATIGPEGALVDQRAFGSAAPVAREHGSLVAALAVDHGMRVYVADVFTTTEAGGQIASADSIAAGLDWMISRDVPVINISIEGPNNPVLGLLVQRAIQRGQVIVAAAGNGGPLARPAFPAAFVGSVAVTAIDANSRPYLRANRGDYITFAAEGVDIPVQVGNRTTTVSGTSFAAPIISSQIARQMGQPSPRAAQSALRSLRERAVDLGAPGRDPVFGWGAIYP